MKTLKKTMTILLIGAMTFAMTACGSSAYKNQVEKTTKALEAAGFEKKNEDYLLKYGNDEETSGDAFYSETKNSGMLRSIISGSVTGITDKDAKSLFYSAVDSKIGDTSSEMNVYIIDFNDSKTAKTYFDSNVIDFDSMLEDSNDLKIMIEDYGGKFVNASDNTDGHYRFCYAVNCETFELDSQLYVDMIIEDSAVTTIYVECDGESGKSIKNTMNSFFDSYGIKGAAELAN